MRRASISMLDVPHRSLRAVHHLDLTYKATYSHIKPPMPEVVVCNMYWGTLIAICNAFQVSVYM